jgi:hypothetical protein
MQLLIAHLCGPRADIMWPAAYEWFHGHIASLPGTAFEWRDEQTRLMQDKTYPKALWAVLDAIKPPLPKPYDSDFAPDFLTYLVCLVVVPPRANRAARATLAKSWVTETGKTWKALREFPTRIKGMAGQIDRMNAHPFLRLKELPTIMRRDAEQLAERLKIFSQVLAEAFPQTPPSLHDLMSIVENWTGRAHDRQVIELLNAADVALNPKQSKPRFDTQKLLDLRSRQKRGLLRT